MRLTRGQTYTALHLASEGGHVDVMALLVSAGASIHAKTKYVRCGIDHCFVTASQAYTPLHHASEAGRVNAVKFLLAQVRSAFFEPRW